MRDLDTALDAGHDALVCDNFSPHKKKQVGDWCAANDVELVFTPSPHLK